jgi:hypothetical protein
MPDSPPVVALIPANATHLLDTSCSERDAALDLPRSWVPPFGSGEWRLFLIQLRLRNNRSERDD